jgi:hypothetical protein
MGRKIIDKNKKYHTHRDTVAPINKLRKQSARHDNIKHSNRINMSLL